MHELADAYMDYLIIEKGLAANSITAYGTDLASYINYLADNGIEEICDADTTAILGWLVHLTRQGLSAKSRASVITSYSIHYTKLYDSSMSGLGMY